MPDKTAYELGARKLMAATGPDPRDDFSQEAAANSKPRLGVGLTEEVDNKKKGARGPAENERLPEPEYGAHPPRDTRGASAPNPDGEPVTVGQRPQSKARSGPKGHPSVQDDAGTDRDPVGEELKKPVKGAVGDALKRHGN